MDSDWLLSEPRPSESTEDLLALFTDEFLASPWWSPNEDDAATSDSPLSSEESESVTTQVTPRPTKKKIRKKRSQTPKDEIELLRRMIEDMENMLQLKSRRRTASPSTSRASGVRTVSVWRGVATRQLQLLCNSQHENRRLREQVQHQVSVLTRLYRLAQRIRAPVESIPQIVAPAHTTIFDNKRRELLATTSAALASVDVISARLSNRLRTEEFRDSTIYDVAAMQGGNVLTEGSVGRVVPRDGSCLSQALWERYVLDDRKNERHNRFEFVDQESNSYGVWLSVSFPTPHGLAVYHGVSVRTRKIDGKRATIVLAGSLWPDASTPPPFNAVAFNGTAVTIFQPHESTPEATEPAGEVLMHNVFTPLEYAVPRHMMTREQVSTLESFVIKARDHTIGETQHHLDSLMLQRL